MLPDRILFILFSTARRSRFGALLVVVGVVLLFALVVLNLVSAVRNVLMMANGAEQVFRFLETGPGIAIGFVVTVLIILIGLGMMLFIRSDSVLGDAEVSFRSERDLEAALQRSEERREAAEKERDAFQEQLASERAAKDEPGSPPTEQSTVDEDREIRELEVQERWRAEDALEAYLNQMQEWLDDEDRPLLTLPYNHQRRMLARTRTLWVLERLDPNGKRGVLRFLHEHKLITGGDPVIRLGGANLSSANLARMG